MKKSLTLLLALALVLTALVGCAKPNTPNEPGSPNTDTPPKPPITDDDYDIIIGGDSSGENNPPVDNPPENNPSENNPPVDNPPVDNPPTTEAPEGSQVASGFLAKQKKYNYGENNIVMLNVTNQNTDNYSVKVEGYYLDADGKVLKTETKFVEGYAAGYVKDFLFNPGIAFDSFKFTLTAEKFDGVCFEQNYVIKGLHLKESYDYVSPFDPPGCFEPVPAQYPAILMGFETFGYHGPVYPIQFYTYYITVDAHGNIYNIHEVRHIFLVQVPTAVNATFYRLRMTHTKEELWPEELRDGYQILFAFTASETEE